MSTSFQPPTAARLTPAGRGAIATIRICGIPSTSNLIPSDAPEPALHNLNSLFQAANGRSLSEQTVGKIAFGQWGWSDHEELVVCRTASDSIEIYCHGGDAAVQRILSDLSQVGCRIVDWFEQISAMTDFFESECHEVLSRTSTWRTTKIVLQQTTGLLRTSILKSLNSNSHSNKSICDGIDELLEWSEFAIHLSTPWNVVLTGRPNVGKSSLINALLGYQRAIVFDQPGTTRDVVTGETAFDGWPVVLADTAGIRSTSADLESAGIALAQQRLKAADLRVILLDISQSPTADDDLILTNWPNAIIVAHKADLPSQWGNRLPKNAIHVSSVSGMGLLELRHELVNRLIPRVPEPGTAIPLTARQIETLQEANAASTNEERRLILQKLFFGNHRSGSNFISISQTRI